MQKPPSNTEDTPKQPTITEIMVSFSEAMRLASERYAATAFAFASEQTRIEARIVALIAVAGYLANNHNLVELMLRQAATSAGAELSITEISGTKH